MTESKPRSLWSSGFWRSSSYRGSHVERSQRWLDLAEADRFKSERAEVHTSLERGLRVLPVRQEWCCSVQRQRVRCLAVVWAGTAELSRVKIGICWWKITSWRDAEFRISASRRRTASIRDRHGLLELGSGCWTQGKTVCGIWLWRSL